MTLVMWFLYFLIYFFRSHHPPIFLRSILIMMYVIKMILINLNLLSKGLLIYSLLQEILGFLIIWFP